ncbi:hypothetical protein GCM10010275_18890 [Streptomyces litmocidini]|uniref:hypothetical protein n=1 Tax=Streptomyces litmocidini TaxID=67318 RepID=UPI00167C5E85|nr:hypothetical protein [Streptomyces litmocidini]GGU83837.1 hypothetical protein GCM10010275_18890 [Streptomyces litmocidini]
MSGFAHPPERPVSVAFDRWPVERDGRTPTPPGHGRRADHVLRTGDRALAPARAAAPRGAGTTLADQVPAP